MEQFINIYRNYISPVIIVLLIIVAIIAFCYLVRFFIQLHSLGVVIEKCVTTSSSINHQLETTKMKKSVVSAYYKKKKAQLSFLISALFFLHIVSDKD